MEFDDSSSSIVTFASELECSLSSISLGCSTGTSSDDQATSDPPTPPSRPTATLTHANPSTQEPPAPDSEETGTHEPLYDGAELSMFESHFLVLSYSLRHSLTKQAVSDLLSLLSKHLPATSMVSYYKLKKFFLDLYEGITFVKRFCCSVCHCRLSSEVAECRNGCEGANPPVEFLSTSIKAQLKRKLQDPVFWSNLQWRFGRDQASGCIRDVLDGEEYQKHADFMAGRPNISLLLNSDDISMFKSSNVSLWPIWLVVNELPPHVRFLRRNLVLAGLWFAEVKPTGTTFLAPFVDEIKDLSNHGFKVTIPESGEVIARARVVMCSVDLPAKAQILNAKQYLMGNLGAPTARTRVNPGSLPISIATGLTTLPVSPRPTRELSQTRGRPSGIEYRSRGSMGPVCCAFFPTST